MARSNNFSYIAFLLLACVSGMTANVYNDTRALQSFRSSADSTGLLLSSWNSSNVCSSSSLSLWEGVTCLGGRVSRLILRRKGLSGSIQALMALTELRILVLADNFLQGQLPGTDLSNWKAIWLLSLSNNNFTGSIPASISYLRRLWRLDLSHNSFSGVIPATSLNTLPRLLTLNLQDNALSGPFPFLSISSLTDLSLQNNCLSGSIPATLNLPNLTNFDVSHNNLSGSIPQFLLKFPRYSFAGNVNLCGGPLPSCNASSQVASSNPSSPTVVPSDPSSLPSTSPSLSRNLSRTRLSLGVIVGFVIGDVTVLLLLSLLFLLYYWRKVHHGEESDEERGEVMNGAHAAEKGVNKAAAIEKSKLVFVTGERRFSLDDLLRASAEMLGRGSLGSVYKAVLEGGRAVAVKRLKEANHLGKQEFEQHMELIGRLLHPHVLPLRAYYYTKDEKLLVYDFMWRGSLFGLLHGKRGSSRAPLDWGTRVRIALGAARGLAHVHEQAGLPHGNFKSTNVLLDGDGKARISDVGLLQLVNPVVLATRQLGYRAPETAMWGSRSPLTSEVMLSDVYAFGVVVLEVLTGKVPVQCVHEEGVELAAWVQSVVREEWTAEVFDVELMRGHEGGQEEEEMLAVLQVAIACCSAEPGQRPRMCDVVKMIEDVCAGWGEGSSHDSPSGNSDDALPVPQTTQQKISSVHEDGDQNQQMICNV